MYIFPILVLYQFPILMYIVLYQFITCLAIPSPEFQRQSSVHSSGYWFSEGDSNEVLVCVDLLIYVYNIV